MGLEARESWEGRCSSAEAAFEAAMPESPNVSTA
jgi:hypothetical protein